MHATSSSCIHSSCAAAYQGPKTTDAQVRNDINVAGTSSGPDEATLCKVVPVPHQDAFLSGLCSACCCGPQPTYLHRGNLRKRRSLPHRQDPFEYWAGSVQAWMGHGESRESGHTVLGSEYLLYFESLGAGRVEITVTTATLNHCMTQSRPIQYRIQLSDPAPCFLQRF